MMSYDPNGIKFKSSMMDWLASSSGQLLTLAKTLLLAPTASALPLVIYIVQQSWG